MYKMAAEALKPYNNLHVNMDDMEEYVNDRMRKLSYPDIASFTTTLKQSQTDIAEFKRQPISSIFDQTFVEIKKEENFMDLIVSPLKG